MNTILALSALVGVTAAASALPFAVPRAPWAATATANAQDPNIRCADNRKTSVAIPFERIYPTIELVPPHPDWGVRGPQMQVVVTDSTMWPAVWHAAVDSVKTPPIAFGENGLILVATKRYSYGLIGLRVTAIRQCRATGVVVVSTLQTRPRSAVIPGPDRAIDLVRLARAPLVDFAVIFDQHLRVGSQQDE